MKSIDLSTRWLGLDLGNPIVASSNPLTGNLDSLRRLEDSGLAAVVLPSIFEEQIEGEASERRPDPELDDDEASESSSNPPPVDEHRRRSDEQLELIHRAKGALSIPVIGSLNGHGTGAWARYAHEIERAGADALELNLYAVPADIRQNGHDVEHAHLQLVERIRRQTSLPLAIKISPFYSSPGHMAARLAEIGAAGLVLFNRFVQPDIDLDSLAIEPRVALSRSEESRLALRWIALLRGHVACDLGATSGIHQATDVLKLLLVGADVTMMASALLMYGPSHIERVLVETREWMAAHEMGSVSEMKGRLSQVNCADPDAFERAQYRASLTTHVWRAGW